MGIHDREYYRKEGPSFLESILPSGLACKWLIAINIAVFVLQLATQPQHPRVGEILRQVRQEIENIKGERLEPEVDALFRRHSMGFVMDWFALEADQVKRGQVWRLLTYSFLHSIGGMHSAFWFSHLFFNMLCLWMFGSDLEELYGRREFVLFYLTASLLGGIVYFLVDLVQGRNTVCIGASGSVMALMILYACRFPEREMLAFYILPVRVWILAIAYMAQDALVLFAGDALRSNVAVVVHLTGGAFAFFYHRLDWHLSSLLPGLWDLPRWLARRRAARKFKLYNPDAEALDEPKRRRPSTTPTDAPEHLEAKLDAVLDKVARLGKESLTEEETLVLLQASEHYKKRRS